MLHTYAVCSILVNCIRIKDPLAFELNDRHKSHSSEILCYAYQIKRELFMYLLRMVEVSLVKVIPIYEKQIGLLHLTEIDTCI